jgi:hypothetical protein
MGAYTKVNVIVSILIFVFSGTTVRSQNLSLKIVGDTIQGFTVTIYSGNQQLLNNTEEFTLRLANLDLSELVELPGWKGSHWEGDKNRMQLTRTSYVAELDLNLTVHVTYEVINQHVIKKRFDLFQSGMPSLYYTIEEKATPAEAPIKYVTFEYDDFPGGLAHEIFPSAGFVTPDMQLVGFLMDAGYKNH